MAPVERRLVLIRLLAEIDQRIAEADRLASDASLDAGDWDYAAAHLDFRRKSVERIEGMLRELER